MTQNSNRKYLFAFIITALIFGTAIFASNYFNQKKLSNIQDIEDQVSLDILSSETEYSLLAETTCSDVPSTTLSRELGDLSDKLAYAESQNQGSSAVANLKAQYSLLEIKDYLLMKQITAKCGRRPTFVLYFYSTDADCPDCQKMGYVLTALHDKYPDLRVYSFDYNLDLEAIHTLLSIYKVNGPLPAMVINSDPYYGFRTLDDLEASVPALKRLKTEYDAAHTAPSISATTSSSKN